MVECRICTVLLDDIDLAKSAILLDVDGTLLDIADHPGAVEVPARLTRALQALADLTAGATALISGRPLDDLDRLFGPLDLALISGHGAEMRLPGMGDAVRQKESLDAGLRAQLVALAANMRGVIVEDKGYSVALHYRLAPQAAAAVREAVAGACAAYSPEEVELLPGKQVIEIKHPRFNKGTALRALMAHPPFCGRRPIFIGDDVTDEAAFAVLPEFNGLGISVGRHLPGAAGYFASPAQVRQWLYRLVSQGRVSRD